MRNKRLVYLYLVIVLAYLATVLFLPLDPEALARYDLSSTQLRLLSLGIALPLVAIWLLSLYSFMRFKNYAEIIKKEKEGKAFAKLAQGLMILSFSFPLNSLLSSTLNYAALEYPGFSDTADILRNYSSLLYQMVTFIVILRGAGELLKTLRPKVKIFYGNLAIAGIVIFSSIFTWLIIGRPFGTDTIEKTYNLPAWLVLATLVIPYLITWQFGILAAHRLSVYYKRVSGEIYKKILMKLVAGICVIISISIFIQVMVALSEGLTRLNFTPILLVVYLLLLGYIIGFGLVARGARQLKRIEEV